MSLCFSVMNQIQMSILDVMQACVYEIQKWQTKSSVLAIKNFAVTLENSLFASFEVTYRNEVCMSGRPHDSETVVTSTFIAKLTKNY
jgi:hypothetical protein